MGPEARLRREKREQSMDCHGHLHSGAVGERVSVPEGGKVVNHVNHRFRKISSNRGTTREMSFIKTERDQSNAGLEEKKNIGGFPEPESG